MVDELDPGLGESPVIPEPIREFRPEPFMQTKAEWAADNREQILAHDSFSSTTTIYTVPNGRVLYITSASMALLDPVSLDTGQNASMEIGARRARILTVSSGTGLHPTPDVPYGGSISITYPMPIKVRSGEFIRVVTSASTVACFQGYLE